MTAVLKLAEDPKSSFNALPCMFPGHCLFTSLLISLTLFDSLQQPQTEKEDTIISWGGGKEYQTTVFRLHCCDIYQKY